MSEKFEAAVEALNSVVKLSAKVRVVRTVEGSKYYKLPIGSVIIADADGKVLETLHKGDGSTASTPPTSSFKNNPEVAKHGATLPGQGAFAGKAQSAFDNKPKPASAPTPDKKSQADVPSTQPTVPAPKTSTSKKGDLPEDATPFKFALDTFAGDDKSTEVKVYLQTKKTESAGTSSMTTHKVYLPNGQYVGQIESSNYSKVVKKLQGNMALFGKEQTWWSASDADNNSIGGDYKTRPEAIRQLVHNSLEGSVKSKATKIRKMERDKDRLAAKDTNMENFPVGAYVKGQTLSGESIEGTVETHSAAYHEPLVKGKNGSLSLVLKSVVVSDAPEKSDPADSAKGHQTGSGVVVEKSGTWLLTVEGNQKSIPVSKGDKVWSAGSIGDFFVEKPDGSAKNYSWNYDFWGSDVSKESLDKKKAAGELSPVNGPEEVKNAKAAELSDADAKTVGKLAAATNLPADSFSAAVVPTPKGEQKVYVTPEAKVYVTGTGAAVLYEDGTSVKFNPLSGKIVTGKIPATATEIKVDGLVGGDKNPSLPSAPSVPEQANEADTSTDDLDELLAKLKDAAAAGPDTPKAEAAAPEKPKKTKISAGSVSKALSGKGMVKGESWSGKVKGWKSYSTGYLAKQSKNKYKENIPEVVVSHQFEGNWKNHNKGKSESDVALARVLKYQKILEDAGFSTVLNKSDKHPYSTLTVTPYKEDAAEAPSAAPVSEAVQDMGQAATGATAALQTLQSAVADLNAGKSVKGTKYGNDSNGAKGWQFTTHTSKNGSLVYTDSDQWGNTYLYEDGTLIPIAGPFAQMQEAKTWLATNGIEQKAPDTSKPLPAAHNVPDDAGKKLKPVSASSKKSTKAVPAKQAAAPKPVESGSSEENFFTYNAAGDGAMVPHPKYGDIAVSLDKDSKVYTTGVGVVVKNSDGSGSVTSGKTGKVEKFDSLPDNKLPKSSTVEVKKKPDEGSPEAAEDALAKAVSSANQKSIDKALDADEKATDPSYTPAELEKMADWEKELLGVPLTPKTPTGLDYVDVPEAEPLHETLATGKIPLWAKPSLVEAKTVLHVKNNKDQAWLVFELPNGSRHGITPVSASGAAPLAVGHDVWQALAGKPDTTVLKGSLEEPASPVSAIPDEIFGDPDTTPSVLYEAIAAGSLPSWMKPKFHADGVDRVWVIPVADDSGHYSLAARSKDGSFKLYFSDSEGTYSDTIITIPDVDKKSVLKNGKLLWDAAGDEGFIFPKPPPAKKSEPAYAPFVDSATVSEALTNGAVPMWLKSNVQSADGAWAIKTTSGLSLLTKKNDAYEIFYAFTSPHDAMGYPVSDVGAAESIAEPSTKKISIAPPVHVSPTAPALASDDSADAPSVNADHAVEKKVAADWIKAKKTPDGYEFVGVTDAEGAPATVVKQEHYWGIQWKTPWGTFASLKQSKAAAAKYGVIDHSKVKSPAEIKAAAAKKAKKTPGVPAGSTLNDLGVPEVEWKGHRFPLFPGMRMFEHEGSLQIFDGKDAVRVTPDGRRVAGLYSQKELKDAGATQIAYGGANTLGKYDFSPLKDASSDKTYSFSVYNLNSELKDLFAKGDLSGMAHFAEFLESPNISTYMAADAKKYVKTVEVAAHILQLQKSIEGGQFDGSLFAKVDAADVLLPMDIGARLNDLRKDFALRSAKSLGYDIGNSVDALDVDQVKALAASRGFELSPYMMSNSDARQWLLTEFTYAGFSQYNVRTGLHTTLKHQKVVAKVAVDSKYEKYLTQPKVASKAEKVAVHDGSGVDQKAAVDAALAKTGTQIYVAYEDSNWAKHVYKTGNIVAAAALSDDPEKAFDALPQATKTAFYARVSAHGAAAVAQADFAGVGAPVVSMVDRYAKFAEGVASPDFSYTPHFEKMQEKFSAENLASLTVKDASKPEDVSAASWALVLAALDKEGSLEKDLLPDAAEYTGSDLHFKFGVSAPLVADAPPMVKQLLAYGQQVGPAQANEIHQSLKAIAQTGVWGTPWSDTYQIPDGPTLYLRPGDKVYYGQPNKTVVYNEFFPESSYGVSSGWGSNTFNFSPLTAYSIPSKGEEPVKSVPVNWDFDMAKGFVPQLDKKTFDSLMSALQGDYHSASKDFPLGESMKGDSIVAVKNFLDTPDFSSDHPTLKSMGVAGVPDGALAALHHASINDDPTVPQMLEVFANYGYFAPKEKTDVDIWVDQLGLDPSKSYFQYLSSAHDEVSLLSSLAGYGPYPITELAEDLSGQSFPDLTAALVHYDVSSTYSLVSKMWDQLQGELGKVEKPKADHDELTLSPINKTLGGMHSKKVWVDQNGNEWMSKAFPSDPNGNYRVDVEHAANEIARLYGYNAPATRVMELEGKHQYVQLLAPASGELGHQSWSSLPESVVIDAMSEHVIDWLVSNHDSHHGNILKTPDGQHAFGIDKGQAGRFFGKDKLAEGYHASNPAPVWYDNVYAAIRTGKMSKDQADRVRDAVLRKAAQVSTRNGERFKELMHESQKNRVDFPSQFPNAQAWVDAHEKRRLSTFDDFVGLYKGLYEKAGYDWGGKDSLDDYLPKKVEDKFHVAPSEELVESVQKYGTLGVPLFYKTGVFADDSMLVYKTKGSDGSDTLRANATLLADADQTFMTWLKSHTIEKVHTSPGSSTYDEPKENHAEMPHLQASYTALVNYAKTVNTHAADGEYNTGTVANAESAKETLQSAYDKVKELTDGDPTKLSDYKGVKFYTHEQQDTWMAHANRMLQQFEVVDQAKSQGVKVSAITDDTPFQMPNYKPSEGLDTSGKPKVVDAYEFNGVIEQKWSDGNYTSTTPQGVLSKSTKGDFGIAAGSGEHKPDYITKDAPAEVEASDESVESVVSVANVPVKVSYQPASSFAKKSSNGFEVTEGKGKVNFTGHEYQIQVGDITIKYQGLEDSSVARAQRGLARIEIGDWDGNPDAMEKVNELFESIGLDIGDATEQSMEIGYYRRLAALANRRKLSAKYKALVEKKIPKTGDQAEVDAYRKLLDGVYGKPTMQEFYDSKGWLPHMPEAQHGGVAGPAHWLRPDSSVEDYKKWTNGRLPIHSIHNHSHTESIATTGLFSTEDRMRILGEWIGGMSSGSDQVTHGSSEYVYWRQNQNSVPSYGVVLEPEFAVAGSNYAAGGDTFGSTSAKISGAHFDLKGQASHSGGGNELMVKKGVTLFDGIAVITVGDEQARAKILKHYADLGIEEIRGIPVAERIVVGSSAAQKTISKVWDLAIEAEKKRKGKVA